MPQLSLATHAKLDESIQTPSSLALHGKPSAAPLDEPHGIVWAGSLKPWARAVASSESGMKADCGGERGGQTVGISEGTEERPTDHPGRGKAFSGKCVREERKLLP